VIQKFQYSPSYGPRLSFSTILGSTVARDSQTRTTWNCRKKFKHQIMKLLWMIARYSPQNLAQPPVLTACAYFCGGTDPPPPVAWYPLLNQPSREMVIQNIRCEDRRITSKLRLNKLWRFWVDSAGPVTVFWTQYCSNLMFYKSW
jgi:hypothetical protein